MLSLYGMTTTIRFDPETESRLSALAKLTGRTKSYYIRAAVSEKLDELEDVYLAEARIENPEKRWSLDDLLSNADLAR